MRLLLDEMIGPAVAWALRERGMDAVAVAEHSDIRALPDDAILEHAQDASRVLVTRNVGDFARLHHLWRDQGKRHQGVVMVTERACAQNRNLVGSLVNALLQAHKRDELPSADELVFLAPQCPLDHDSG